jgi:hypothetical protein
LPSAPVRIIAHVGKDEPDEKSQDNNDGIHPDRTEHGIEAIQQSRILGKETGEESDIEDKDEEGDHAHHQRIADTIDEERSQQFGEGDLVVFRDHAATPDFTDTRQDQIDGIVAKHRIDDIAHLVFFAERIDEKRPAIGADDIGKKTEKERQGNNIVSYVTAYDSPDLTDIELTVE